MCSPMSSAIAAGAKRVSVRSAIVARTPRARIRISAIEALVKITLSLIGWQQRIEVVWVVVAITGCPLRRNVSASSCTAIWHTLVVTGTEASSYSWLACRDPQDECTLKVDIDWPRTTIRRKLTSDGLLESALMIGD